MLTLAHDCGHTLLGPTAPALLNLSDLVRWQLQPRRAYTPGESAVEDLELRDTDCDRQRFDQEVLADAAKVFGTLDRPLRLSDLLASLQADGCPIAMQDAVTLEAFENFDPEEESGLLPFHVRRAEANGLHTVRCHGDDLWIEPLENES